MADYFDDRYSGFEFRKLVGKFNHYKLGSKEQGKAVQESVDMVDSLLPNESC